VAGVRRLAVDGLAARGIVPGCGRLLVLRLGQWPLLAVVDVFAGFYLADGTRPRVGPQITDRAVRRDR
jgi:hypothetical protein